MSRYVHYLPGGGLGDVYREAYFHNVLGVLRRWKLLNPGHSLRVVLMSHNPSSIDWLTGQGWIDEPVQVPFPLEKTWNWEACYQLYPEQFEGHREIRFYLPSQASLYRSDLAMLRPKVTDIETIQPLGMANGFVLEPDETHVATGSLAAVTHLNVTSGVPLVFHPYAGEVARCIPDDLKQFIEDSIPPWDRVTIAKSYDRPNHAEETGLQLKPRQLAMLIARSKRVIAAESSVYYIASMLGVPFIMLYAECATFAMVKRGESTWAWYFGENNPANRFLSFDQDREVLQNEIASWLKPAA